MPTTLTPDHVPSLPCVSERDKHYNSVFTTALEGGIGYWSQCSRYFWSIGDDAMTEALDFIAVVHDVEDEDETAYVIDRSVIASGIRRALKHGGWNAYHTAALAALSLGNFDDADYDSDTADLIVQFGLFNEQRYA
jgi:hypothetical protein